MPANQKYSTRVHTKRQLSRANEHIKSASTVLCEVKPRYEIALPRVSLACAEMVRLLGMIECMIEDIRQEI